MSAGKRVLLLLVASLFCGHEASGVDLFRWIRKLTCEDMLVAEKADNAVLLPKVEVMKPIEALQAIDEEVPVILKARGLTENPPPWTRVLHNYLLPSMISKSKPIVVTVVGPANSGKSTLFNSLPDLFRQAEHLEPPVTHPIEISKVGFMAGLTQRPVILLNEDLIADTKVLRGRFGAIETWTDMNNSTQGGLPVVHPLHPFFENIIFVDSPPFDIQQRRELADQAFLWSDIIFYVFSGTNYRNDLNLEMIRQGLDQVGGREVVLINRTSAMIPEADAYRQFAEVAEQILPHPGSSANRMAALPSGVAAAYLFVESDAVAAGKTDARFIPQIGSAELPVLLSRFEHDSDTFRKAALKNSLNYALNGAATEMNMLQQSTESVEVTEAAIDVLLQDTVNQLVEKIPYHRLGAELEKLWYSRARGPRNIARWLAHPLRMFYGSPSEISAETEVFTEIDKYIDSLIDRDVGAFRLAASEGIIRVDADSPEFLKFSTVMEDYRKSHRIAATSPPFAEVKNATAEIHLLQTPEVREQLRQYLNRDWPAIAQRIKLEARENLANLTLHIQGEFSQLMRERGLFGRSASAAYTTLAILPAVTALAYMVYDNVTLTNPQALLTFFGAHVAARLFVYLDEQSLRSGWTQIVSKWYVQRQAPRLMDILKRNLRVARPDQMQQANADMARMQMALTSLSRRPVFLPGPDGGTVDNSN